MGKYHSPRRHFSYGGAIGVARGLYAGGKKAYKFMKRGGRKAKVSKKFNSGFSLSQIKRKQKRHRRQGGGSGGSNSGFSTGRKSSIRKYVKFMSKGNYTYNSDQIFTTALGKQTPVVLGNNCYVPDVIQAIKQTVTAAGSPLPAQNSMQKFLIRECTSRYVVRNLSNQPMTIWFYDAMPRFDLEVNQTTAYDWNAGLIQELAAVGSYNTPFVTPFQSKLFTQFWKVCKVVKKQLQPGEEHYHTVRNKCNWWVDYNRLAYTTSYVYANHRTIQTFAVAVGSIAKDVGGTNRATYCIVEAASLVSQEYKVSTFQAQQELAYANNTLLTTAIGIPTAILEDTDAVAATGYA